MSALHLAPPPSPFVPAATRSPHDPDGDPPVTLWHVGKRLGVGEFGADRLVNHVGQLVRDFAFPRPLPAPCKGKVVEGVHRNSQWVRAAVDHWFAGFIPAEAAAALDEAAQAAAAAEMDARAANLRVVR